MVKWFFNRVQVTEAVTEKLSKKDSEDLQPGDVVELQNFSEGRVKIKMFNDIRSTKINESNLHVLIINRAVSFLFRNATRVFNCFKDSFMLFIAMCLMFANLLTYALTIITQHVSYHRSVLKTSHAHTIIAQHVQCTKNHNDYYCSIMII